VKLSILRCCPQPGGPACELRRDAGWEELRHGAAG